MTASERIRKAREIRDALDKLTLGPTSHFRFGSPRRFVPTDSHGREICQKCGNESREGFTLGQRVQLHPATDAWMAGDRYGQVVRFGAKYAYVVMDRSGRTRKVSFENLLHIA